MSNPAISIFFSYSHLDESLRDELAKHLKLLERQGAIATWHDRKITAGQEWANAIDHHLETAQIILLLVSVNFLASDYCYDLEMKRALERHETGAAKVIPIILKPVDWEFAPFGKLQALPKDGKPITQWENQDEAFASIAKSLRGVAEEMQRSHMVQSSPTAVAPLSLWIQGWKRRSFEGVPTVELDWTEHFDLDVFPRRTATQEIWDKQLFPSLDEAKQSFPMGSVIDVRGQIPLSAAFAIGTKFLDVEGYTLQVLQRTSGRDLLWKSSAQRSDAMFHVIEEVGQPGEDLLLMLAVTGSGRDAAFRLYQSGGFDAVVYAEPVSGTGEDVIASDGDAVALAIDGRRLIRECRDRYGARCVHLVLFCPVGFALFLGMRSRFGEVLTYEFDGRQGYQASVRI
ncbi:MAG: SAVED domain-containing protein [Leptolyngbya sp. UWPOB_LEPTO1]|uniref:SAVED domain-containing protein n=1 Tax=Leptolyngbya sp. UWPOB_LEPTO1 TaxID=2815653 RepID=UPI001AC13842|nr:SAVED domain-containing protein [Leptolyngbya sp. UWPOB_LEPTO1]MBN8563467.1 SAVED domain-containing protein [Leptolyngbya sp. UWPOB_LEPTO1]